MMKAATPGLSLSSTQNPVAPAQVGAKGKWTVSDSSESSEKRVTSIAIFTVE